MLMSETLAAIGGERCVNSGQHLFAAHGGSGTISSVVRPVAVVIVPMRAGPAAPLPQALPRSEYQPCRRGPRSPDWQAQAALA